jgi:predicted ester cyclase
MITEQNREIIRQLYSQVIARKHFETSYKPRKMDINQSTAPERHVSLKAFNRFYAIISEAFPDYDLVIENLLAKEDRVMVRYTINGTHKGNFMGMPPTNERIPSPE